MTVCYSPLWLVITPTEMDSEIMLLKNGVKKIGPLFTYMISPMSCDEPEGTYSTLAKRFFKTRKSVILRTAIGLVRTAAREH